ncbi:MAG: hypothetical protein NVSMB20_21710 [Bradyrhizobium sp.]
MPIIDRIEAYADELTAIRRDLHAHPEIGFEEVRTSGIVADKLTQWGIEVHRGLGGTGVVGVLKGKGQGGKRIGLRADMDALPMEENTNLRWRSTIPGRFHGCGHDGHTTMLLGTARYLAETRNFDGTVHFIFQPAEENGGGGAVMVGANGGIRQPRVEVGLGLGGDGHGLNHSPAAMCDRRHVATCAEFGPRFLHSTGQAYKGGPDSGVFLQITADDAEDLPVPGQKASFGVIKAAQARGDFDVLTERGRRALRVHLKGDLEAGLKMLDRAIAEALN